MNRIEVMELVRARQVGELTRRDFISRATAAVGGLAAANLLLAACAAPVDEIPPPVVDETQPPPEPGTSSEGELTTGIVTYPGLFDGEDLMGYVAYQNERPARPAVVVIQEWWGLNEHIKELTRRFAAAGYVALAPDLYHGQVTTEPDEARKLAMELSMGDAVGEIRQAIAYLRTLDEVSGPVGAVGFCMGGGLVYQTAAHEPSLGAGVGFYGRTLEAETAAEVIVPVLSFLGTADGLPVPALEAMHAVFDESDVPNDFQIYDGAQHAFFNDTRASYDEAAAADAWERTLAWFAEWLG